MEKPAHKQLESRHLPSWREKSGQARRTKKKGKSGKSQDKERGKDDRG